MMNDQTSPTAGGQRPDPQDPHSLFSAPRDASELPPDPPGGSGAGGSARTKRSRRVLAKAGPDLAVGGALVAVGALFGVLGGPAWYRFSPTVWLSLPADAVGQLKSGSGLDTSSLLVAPEAKGLASVDGYYFMVTAIAGLLLGTLAFYLGRRGFGSRPSAVRAAKARLDPQGPVSDPGPPGAGVGAWAGVLVGGFLASAITAALGHWMSLAEPVRLLRSIADGHAFHAPVSLHATGLYLAAPLLALVVFTALTAAFTSSPPPPEWLPYGDRPLSGYFTPENPYGLQPPGGHQQSGYPQAYPSPGYQLPAEPAPSGGNEGGGSAAPYGGGQHPTTAPAPATAPMSNGSTAPMSNGESPPNG
jgi:hypothetical protein